MTVTTTFLSITLYPAILQLSVSLKIWKYNGSWYEDGWNGSRILNVNDNIVGVNITSFSIFSPLSTSVDRTPPASISNLLNTTGNFWINWTWSKPSDADFNHTVVYIDGSFVTNTSSNYYNLSTTAHATHTLSTHTVDVSGNINQTWVNYTWESGINTDSISVSMEHGIMEPNKHGGMKLLLLMDGVILFCVDTMPLLDRQAHVFHIVFKFKTIHPYFH